MDNIIKEFLAESYESLDQLERDLVDLEKDPTSRDLLDSIFRTVHNQKGGAGVLGFSKLGSISHVGENLLSRLRDGELVLTPEITNVLLKLVDAVREILDNLDSTSNEGDRDYSQLVEELARLGEGKKISKENDSPAKPPESKKDTEEKKTEPVAESKIPVDSKEKMDKIAMVEKNPSIAEKQLHKADNSESTASESKSTGISESNIRVNVSLLDKLMNLVGELVLVRNQILQYAATTHQGTSFVGASQRLNLITTELQEGVMKTRMQPIGNIWSKFPRVIRDLTAVSGKKIVVNMEGKDTELDKTIIEAIKAPLMHLVRNAADHGLETPEKRESYGKSTEGHLSLRAFHEGGQVNVEITDDGGGIDPERIMKKALQRSLLTHDEAVRMTPRDLINMIFLPGFSTSEKVTNVSGRGVGMDVVKTNIEKIGGTIDVDSKLHEGTTFKIKIPLTLAIIPALVITSGGDRYAIPQVSLLELVRLEGEHAKEKIEMIQGAPVYRLRGSLLPLVYLNQQLQVESISNSDGEQTVNIVVLQADDRQFGLVVDEINDTQEIVVKPLGKQLKGIPVFAGATIMGDGKVALILDVMGIAQAGNIISKTHDRYLHDKNEQIMDSVDEQTLLLFKVGGERRMGIQLSMVARLEEFPRASVEKAGDYDVMQYRGQIMPLVYLSDILSPGSGDFSSETMKVVVYSDRGRSVGLAVDQILDIVEVALKIQKCENRHGILGSAVIQNCVTDILDLNSIIRAAAPPFFQESEDTVVRV